MFELCCMMLCIYVKKIKVRSNIENSTIEINKMNEQELYKWNKRIEEKQFTIKITNKFTKNQSSPKVMPFRPVPIGTINHKTV